MKNKIYLFALLLIISCGKEELQEPQETILAKIGDKSISVSEFIRRAEYTVRPPYCRGDHNLDKKIVLNSIIAEKLMSIAASDTNSFIMNESIQTHLRGRKEQLMRKWLYETEALHKVEVDSAKILNTVGVAGRKYKLSYFNIPDSAVAHKINEVMRKKDKTFEEIYLEATGMDTLPQREVEWSTHEHEAILDSLYSEPLKKNQIVGPVRVNKTDFMMIKINGWINQVAITQQQIQERWRNVSEKYSQRQAVKLYDEFILDVMKGKSIEFTPDVFFKMAELLGPIYIQTDAKKKAMLNKSFWNKDDNTEKFKDIETQMSLLYQEPFFSVDGEVWTVRDFVDELKAHPLVFRKKSMKNKEFGQQLQFAIMDMIRDKYLAQIVYERGYDKINIIQRNVNMWRDNLNYHYYKDRFLRTVLPDTLKEMDYIPLIEDHLNPLVDSLQQKYSDQIEVDVEAFNEIKLTRIDMSVTEKNVPFSKVVPSFPLVTTDNKLDYGKRMNKDNEQDGSNN